MLADHRRLVDDLVRDVVGRLGEAARDRAIGLAVVQYGKDRPRQLLVDETAEAGDPPRLPLPAQWVAGESAVVSIEHPIGHVPPCLLPRQRWAVLPTPGGEIIALQPDTTIGATCRLTYTAPHLVEEVLDTVPPGDREAVAQYAASLLLEQLANTTAGDKDSTIKSDSVDHGAATPKYAARADTARQRYHDLLGIDRRRQQPASVTVHPPMASTTGSKWFLFRRSAQ